MPNRKPDDYIVFESQKIAGISISLPFKVPGWRIDDKWNYFFYFDDGQELRISNIINNKEDMKIQLVWALLKIKSDKKIMDQYQV